MWLLNFKGCDLNKCEAAHFNVKTGYLKEQLELGNFGYAVNCIWHVI